MMRWVCLIGMLGLVDSADGAEGRAKVELLAASRTYQPGRPVEAGIRITYERGWHGYWVNPGEGGMKTEAKWTLPAGWTAGDLDFPAPVGMKTGELFGYGYEGGVILPVTLHPPAAASGRAGIAVKVVWLACNDGACEPGSATLHLTLDAGQPAETPDAAALLKARKMLPVGHPGLVLGVSEKTDGIHLEISGENLPDLDGAEVFPVTGQALGATKPVHLRRDGNSFSAVAAKSTYASGPLRELQLVIAGGRLERPVLATWKIPP